MPVFVRRVLLAMTACMLLAPAVAQASWQSVVNDCAKDGKLDQHHSLADYTQALNHLPTDVIEYTDCQSKIRRAQLAAAGSGKKGSTSSGGGGGANTPSNPGGGSSAKGGSSSGSPASTSSGSQSADVPDNKDPLATASAVQRSAVTHAIRSGGQPVKVGNEVVDPAALGASPVGSPTSLPPALIVLLVALGIGALGIAVAAVLPRVRARRAR